MASGGRPPRDPSEAPGLHVGGGDDPKAQGGDDAVRRALLRNPVRRAIVDALSRKPGLNKNQVTKEVDSYSSLVTFHLERLEEHGIVVVEPSAREREYVCFLAEDAHLWDDEHTRILFGRGSPRRIGIYVAANPGARTSQIAEEVGLSEVTVLHHLRPLREHGIVERLRIGRSYQYHPSQRLERWMTEVGHAYRSSLEEPTGGAFEG